jgi:hypothetical protein
MARYSVYMRRQENFYETVTDSKTRLRIVGKNTVVVDFASALAAGVKLYQWSHRGKGVIVNEFGVTIAAHLAQEYGFAEGEWTRIVANHNYTADNYTLRTMAGADNAAIPNVKHEFDAMGIPFHERIRYKNKHVTTALTVPRYDGKAPIVIQINEFLVQYVPTLLGVRKGVVVCKDGTPLKRYLLQRLDIGVDVAKYWAHTNIQDEFDLRFDTVTMTYMSRKIDRMRYHFVTDEDDEEYVVLEVREEAANTRFWWQADIDAKWRVPYGNTVHQPRVSYVIVDTDVFDRIDDVFYDDKHGEWMVRDSESNVLTDAGFIKPTQLKRLVANRAGLQIDNVFIQPELNARYKKAMECTAGLDSVEGRRAARIRARYENHSSLDGGKAMYSPARNVKRRQVIADKMYFCPSIYGGVGVWCFDMRKQSVRLRGITSPEQDNALT